MQALILICIFAYFMGAIPTGFWIGKLLKGIDIRTVGSGSTGATNVLRSVGKAPAVFVLAFDMFKGAFPVLVGVWACQGRGEQLIQLPACLMLTADPAAQQSPLLQFFISNFIPGTLAGIIAMIGHSKSIFLGFQGGKSAATGLGTLAAMNLYCGLSMFAVFVSTIYLGRYVSVGSLLAAASGPFFMYYFTHGQLSFVIYNIIGSSYVFIRHKSNIKRLLAGTEPKIGQKSENKTASMDYSVNSATANSDEVKKTNA